MPRLCLSLLGTFQAKLDGVPITAFESDKVRALLAYLAVESDHPQRRETLAGLLWPDMAERDARTNLRHVLAHLRKILGDRESVNPFLLINRQTIQFNSASNYKLDAKTFVDAMTATTAHEHTNLEDCEVCESRLSEAEQLYSGEFLAGFSLPSDLFEEWVVIQRENLHIQVLDVLDHLAEYHEHNGDYNTSQRYAKRQVELEPWRESAHRQLMRVYALSGQRGMALAQYETCWRILETELGIEPEVETADLLEKIRRGALKPESHVSTIAPIHEPKVKPPVPHNLCTSVIPAEMQIADNTPQTSSPQTLAQLEGERRVVTALIAGVKGSITQPEDVDIETWAEMMQDVIPILENAVNRFGGEINQYRDDGLLVLFGTTTVHEDDPERAVLTALAMQEGFERYAANLPTILTLRAGINTGEVIATFIGDRHASSTTLGRVAALAEQMSESAEPGTVLVAEATYRLIEPLFEWQTLGRFQIKGVRAPLAVYRPLVHKEPQNKGRGIEGLESSLVGRDSEFQVLLEAAERLKNGLGGIVTVVGDGGIGKSRLVTELKSRVLDKVDEFEVNWLEGRCLSYATNVAYQVWTSMLRTWLGTSAGTSPEEVSELLQAHVRIACPSMYGEVYPFLARLLSLTLDGGATMRLRGIDAEGLQVLTFRALETLIESAAQLQPLYIVCEDLQWADPTSLAMLELLFPLTDSVPLLLVCIMRPETTNNCWHLRELAERSFRHRHTDLWLDPLSYAESGTLVSNLLQIEGLSMDLRSRILKRAEGNPFFLEEILRSLIEDEAIIYDAVTDPSMGLEKGRWIATRERDDLNIPDTLHGVLTARIDRLDPQIKRLLQLASVVGRTFSHKVLEIMTEGEGAHELDSHLIILQRAQLIQERVRLPEREYIFKHVLTQEAVYNGLLKRERRTLHRLVAASLERLYPEQVEEYLGLLANHWEQTEDIERAVLYLRRAGEQAVTQYANAEAVDYLSRALKLVPETDSAVRYDMLLSREKVYDLLGKRDLQTLDLMQMEVLAAKLDADYPQAGKSHRAEVGLHQIRLAIRTGKYREAEEIIEDILMLAQKSQDPYAEAALYREWGRLLAYKMYGVDSTIKVEHALAIARKAGLTEIEVDSLHTLGGAYSDMDVIKAQATFEQELMLCREIGSRNHEGIALRDLASAFLEQGDYPKALSYAEQSLRVCREAGNRRDEGWALLCIGLTYLGQHGGNENEIEEYAMQALKIFRETKDMVGLRMEYFLLLWSAASQDDDAKMLSYAEQALNTLRQEGHPRYEGTILYNFGHLLFLRGKYVEAKRNLEQSYRISCEINHRPGQGETLVKLGSLFFTLGDFNQARLRIEESLSIACETKRYELECECLVTLGFTAHATGDEGAAYKYGQQALTLAQEKTNRYWLGPANLLLGHTLSSLCEWEAALTAYNQSIDITEKTVYQFHFLKTPRILETKAGLSHLKLICGDHSSALVFVEDILQFLQEKPRLFYTWEPFRVYLTCYQVLEANRDARAQNILEKAYTLLQERAATIEDEALHHSFLENVPANREIVKLWGHYHNKGS